ncbi:MAG: ATP-binding protein [Syntrophales bacterium]|nr:ATP-binding protein [Syntrophales bacterium]
MIAEVERLNRVITGLIDLARPRKPHFENLDMGKVINYCLGLVAEQAGRRGVGIVTDIGESCFAWGDRDQLRQGLLNLFLNALDAMKEGGTLSVVCHRQGERLVIRVIDTGHGIPRQDRERIFDPYFTTKPQGTGLGLAVAARIMDAHGGELRVESEVGRGSTFIVSLPVQKT